MKGWPRALLLAGMTLPFGLWGASSSHADAGKANAEANVAPAPKVAEVGKPAPDFTLKDTAGKTHHLSDYAKEGRIVVLEWFNPDCPFVKKHHEKSKNMAATFERFKDKNVVWLAINSGGPGKQGHGLERNVKAREDYGISYPVLLDEAGAVGGLYAAKTTPHMFVIDKEGTLVYEGAIDDDRSPSKLGKTNYVSSALTSLFAGKVVEPATTKPYGCSVKYVSGTAELP
jgi:peroxiredoxin